MTLTQFEELPTITIVEGSALTHPLLSSAGSFDITYTYGGLATSATSTLVSGRTDFLTAGALNSTTGSKEATQTFSFAENGTSSVREQTIQFTAENADGSKSVTEEILITQSGAAEAPSISVSTDSDISGLLSASSGTITATITLGGSATGFQVVKDGDADDSFIAAFSSDVGDRTDNTLTIDYSRNRAFHERFADLTFTTTGGVGSAATQTLRLRQALSVVLEAVSHDASQYTETFVSALAPLGATAYRTEVVSNSDNFLSVITPTGDLTSGSSALIYHVTENGGAEREGEIEITYTDADGGLVTIINVVVVQSAQILVATTNADGDAVDITALPAEGGVITATITLAGTLTNWTAAKSDTNRDFTLNRTLGNTTNNTFTITYTENTAETPRTVTITVGVLGTSASVVLNLTQLGASPITVVTAPTDLTAPIPSIAGTLTIDLDLSASATGWSAAVSKGALIGGEGFVEIDKTASGDPAPANRITVSYMENTTTEDRVGEITITPVLSSGTPTPIVIPFTQFGVPGIALTLASVVDVGHLAGRLVIGVDLLGSGAANTWSVSAKTSNPPGFFPAVGTITGSNGISVPSTSEGNDGDVLTVGYSENDGIAREGTLTFTALRASGTNYRPSITQDITIKQAAGAPTLDIGSIRLRPATAHATALPASGTTLSVTYGVVIGGGATDWSVEATQGDFFTLTKNGMNPIFTVRLEENATMRSLEKAQ